MKHELLEILACPVCRGPLELTETAGDDDEITSGELNCPHCCRRYPIIEGIPHLLPPTAD